MEVTPVKEEIKAIFTTLIIVGTLVVSLWYADVSQLANFMLNVITIFIFCMGVVLSFFASFFSSDAGKEAIVDPKHIEKNHQNFSKLLGRRPLIYFLNTTIVLIYTACWVYAASVGYYWIAAAIMFVSIVTFYFPRVMLATAEYVNTEKIRYDERQAMRRR